MNTAEMRNWRLEVSGGRFLAPELIKTVLVGNIYNDSRGDWDDGDEIQTSSIREILEQDGYKIVCTKNTKYRVYPDTVNPDYEKQYPDAFKRLSMLPR